MLQIQRRSPHTSPQGLWPPGFYRKLLWLINTSMSKPCLQISVHRHLTRQSCSTHKTETSAIRQLPPVHLCHSHQTETLLNTTSTTKRKVPSLRCLRFHYRRHHFIVRKNPLRPRYPRGTRLRQTRRLCSRESSSNGNSNHSSSRCTTVIFPHNPILCAHAAVLLSLPNPFIFRKWLRLQHQE